MRNKRLFFTIIMLLGFVYSMAQNANREIINPPKKQDKSSKNQIIYSDKSIKAFFIDEDFEGGSLPAGWTTQDGDNSWIISSDNSNEYWSIPAHTVYASINDAEAELNANPSTYIETPPFDLTGISEAKLSFDCFYNDEYGGFHRVKISTDAGMSWDTLTLLTGTLIDWDQEIIDLTDYLGYNDVRIAFHYSDTANSGTSAWANGLAIDNVKVFEPLDHDIGIQTLTPTFLVEGTQVNPEVKLFNFGNLDEGSWSITLSDGVSYDETISNEAVITSETDYIVSFPPWSPTIGTYELTATLTLSNDGNLENNTKVVEVTVASPFSEHAVVGNGYENTYYEFELNDGSVTNIGSVPSSPIPTAEEFAANNQIFRVDNNGNLYTVNYTNGTTSYLTSLNGLTGGIPVGLAYNWNTETMYIASTDGSNITYLSTLNLSSFNTTLIGSGTYSMSGMDFDENGNLYATTLADSLVQINTSDASITNIGYIGHDFYKYHDLSYDRKNNLLLTIDITSAANYYGFYDLETGDFKKITELPGIWDNITFTHYYIPYTVTFNVTDGASPLQNATVTINGQTLTTNSSGETSINLTNDTYDYTVDMDGYDQASGSVTVQGANITENVVLNETTYTATFTVTDGSAPLEGATISITGESDITTDASGIATIDLPNGSYDYTASLAGYDDFNGTFSISDAAEAVEVVMIETTYTATFTVTDGADPLDGATVSITGESDITTDTNGQATIELVNGTYDYTVTLAGYDDNTGSFTIADAAEAIDVTMIETTYTATFTVTNGTDSLEGAIVSITGETDLTTNASGQATIELPNGTYDYTVTLAGYDDNTGSFTIADAAEAIDVTMVETTYTATFTVTDGTAPIVGATVSISGENDITTDASGIATIELTNGDYDYTVSYDGYYDSIGTVTIADSNIDVNIVLHEVGINDLNTIGITVYPNPTNGVLYLNSEKSYTVRVSNTIGNMLFEKQFNGDGTIDLSKQAPGIYFLRVRHNNTIVTKRIILN